jgi:hypothetical protein
MIDGSDYLDILIQSKHFPAVWTRLPHSGYVTRASSRFCLSPVQLMGLPWLSIYSLPKDPSNILDYVISISPNRFCIAYQAQRQKESERREEKNKKVRQATAQPTNVHTV